MLLWMILWMEFRVQLWVLFWVQVALQRISFWPALLERVSELEPSKSSSSEHAVMYWTVLVV